MKNLGILKLFPNYLCDSERLCITSPGHDNRESQQRGAEQREKLILIDSVFVERVIGKLALGNLDSSEVLNMFLEDLDDTQIACSCIS